MKLTKSQIKEWLNEKLEDVAGKFIDAEEAGNENRMLKMEEKEEAILTILEEIDKI